jgi:hypothetical protein
MQEEVCDMRQPVEVLSGDEKQGRESSPTSGGWRRRDPRWRPEEASSSFDTRGKSSGDHCRRSRWTESSGGWLEFRLTGVERRRQGSFGAAEMEEGKNFDAVKGLYL